MTAEKAPLHVIVTPFNELFLRIYLMRFRKTALCNNARGRLMLPGCRTPSEPRAQTHPTFPFNAVSPGGSPPFSR